MKRKATYPLALAGAAAVILVTGFPLRAGDADGTIESAFKQTYVYRTYLKDDAITAEAKDGVVTLAGTVAEESHKALAQETMANLAGVTQVVNQLATKAEAAAEYTDGWIGRKVKLALLFHRAVDPGKTSVEVKDGIVTLGGEASSTAQKDLTTEYAQDIEGVRGVRNVMAVAATPGVSGGAVDNRLDDASVTAQVKTALMTHRSTRSINTRVTTRDGEVTLTGIAKNEDQRALVAKLVTDIQGVISVKNQMTVVP